MKNRILKEWEIYSDIADIFEWSKNWINESEVDESKTKFQKGKIYHEYFHFWINFPDKLKIGF